ncbi:unnamed protein product [Urochloa decumbens]|uniref:Exportin-5 C-terminal domain-containing protein n=1 Tax=Urochloa decumbens TaxID=240449 RepID=A0ABC9A6L9_9POAL
MDDAACSAAVVAPVSQDLGCWAPGSPNTGLKPAHMEENYVNALVSASLRMLKKGLPVEVQCLGVRMLQHLVYFRKKELNSTQFAGLRKVLVGSLDDLVLKDATSVTGDPMVSTANPKENNKHKRCLLVVLAVNINLSSLAAMETDTVIGDVTGQGNLSPLSNMTSNSDQSRYRSCGFWNKTSCSSVFEDYDFVPFMDHPDNIADIINACKEYVEVAKPAMLVNVKMMSSHREKGSLLLMEHNVISHAFLTLISYSGIHQNMDLVPCLLSLLNKIWTLVDWKRNYLHHGSGLNHLFSDVQFLKMIRYVVRFYEAQLRRVCTDGFAASRSCEVTIVQLSLPLILELLQCIHGMWYRPVAYSLSEVLKSVKCLDPCSQFEPTDKLLWINDGEGSHVKVIRQLIEGIRESGNRYTVIGLCASIEGAFSWLLNRSAFVTISKYLASLEFRHLSKLIKLTVIPLVKNCPLKFWKEWVGNFLQQLLIHCEDVLHLAWSKLLYHGCAGARYYFGKLSGEAGRNKTLEMDTLLEITREVSGLLEVIALTEQSRALEDKEAISFHDSMLLDSLSRYLVNDYFGDLRMGLFGYFVDDISTAKAIPFCRSLVYLAVASNEARLKIFVLDNLLPCLIQRLDDELPCSIQRLKSELASSGSNNTTKDLTVLCHEIYDYMLNCGHMQTEALIRGHKNVDDFENSFEVWLGRQKEDFRAKACSAAAKEVSLGYPWKWEDIYLDKTCLLQKLRPEFRAKYVINSCAHPHMQSISSIQQRKYYSMATVVRNSTICNLVRQLIKLKPYIKGSDRPCDVICRVTQTSEIPAEFYKYAAPSVDLLLRSVLFFWEPRFHPMIREAQMDNLSATVDVLMRTECLKSLVPTVTDFPLHLQPYALEIIETKLKEAKYYIAKQQTSLHEEFDEYLASGKLDDDMNRFMSSKDDFVEFAVTKVVPDKFRTLECSLIKLSFERRTEIVHMQNDNCTYAEHLLGLFASEPLKVQAQSFISQLEAENFFDVDGNRVDWGKASLSELVNKFNSELFSRGSLPKPYAIRGLIDCRAILSQKDISLDEAVKMVVDDVRNSSTGYLQMFWKDTRYYRHQYYDIIRDPLRQFVIRSIGVREPNHFKLPHTLFCSLGLLR